jgi:hypothetical protein
MGWLLGGCAQHAKAATIQNLGVAAGFPQPKLLLNVLQTRIRAARL